MASLVTPFCSLLLFFFFFGQASSKLHDSFTIVFTQNSSILHRAVHQLVTYSQLWSLTRWFELVTEQLWLHLWHHFVHFYTMKCNYLLFMKTGRVCHPLLTWWLNGVWSMVLQPYIYWGSLWGQTFCSVIDGKLQLKHAPAAKK